MCLIGVGDSKFVSQHGVYQVTLPLSNESEAKLSGACLDQITLTFPQYPLKIVMKDMQKQFESSGGNSNSVPSVIRFVGGYTDFMIGAKYHRYYPEQIFQLQTGITVYKSKFLNVNCSDEVFGGPHKLVSQMQSNNKEFHVQTYLTNQYQLYKLGYQVNPDLPLLPTHKEDYSSNQCHPVKAYGMLQAAENASNDCKRHEHTDMISVKEEIEQEIIDKSIQVDLKN